MIALLAFAAALSVPQGPGWMPPVPGALNPAVTQGDVSTTICRHGWTKTIRPPASYTNRLKAQQMEAEGITASPRALEEDHLVSLEIGGSPTSPENLWPEWWVGQWGAHRKDVLETRLKRLVCSGKVPLATAQREIEQNWIAAYRKYVGVPR